jgi:uncharacterized protein
MNKFPKIKRVYFAAILPLALAPFLIGASSDDNDIGPGSTRLSVTGVGYDSQPVTFLQMSAGVESFSTDASNAMADNASKLDRVRNQLARYGVSEKDFQTSNISLSPGSNYDGKEHIKGFVVRHVISVVLRQPAKAGEVLDALVSAGANNISGPVNYWEASPAAAARARTEAIKDAMTRANIYAKALSMKVNRIVSINDNSGYASNRPRPGNMAFEASATRIDPGQENVSVSIAAVFELSKS